MLDKKIVYITTNNSWSGSEELWTRSAQNFIEKKYLIAYASKYSHNNISRLKGTHYLFKQTLFDRIIRNLSNAPFSQSGVIVKMLKKERPILVILSQGNNIDNDNIMKCCRDLAVPYISITNLVTEYHFLSINSDNLGKLQEDYLGAKMNYFVAAKNLELNNRMLAIDLKNAEVIFCPVILSSSQIPVYPKTNNIYKIGLVGRIECYHKGYDLLLQLACMNKWKSRPVEFNIYGDGPHTEILRQDILRLGTNNIQLRGYEKSEQVWKNNHILFMPSRMEGVALSLIEAMYCKRAAIVTDVGDAATLITDGFNGFIAPSATVKSLDEALEKAWEKRDQWEELGTNASFTLNDKYSLEAVEYFNKKVEHIIDDLSIEY